MSSRRVRVTITHAQAAAVKRIVEDADARPLTDRPGITAAWLTEWARTLRSARGAVGQIEKALQQQRERREDREAAR